MYNVHKLMVLIIVTDCNVLWTSAQSQLIKLMVAVRSYKFYASQNFAKTHLNAFRLVSSA